MQISVYTPNANGVLTKSCCNARHQEGRLQSAFSNEPALRPNVEAKGFGICGDEFGASCMANCD